MVARRLMVFAVVLLVVTAISTALAPPRRSTPSAPRVDAQAPIGDSAVIRRELDAGAADPTTISLEEGDRLQLTVRSEEAGTVELAGLGQVRAIAPETDVVFDVLPTRPGSYPVLFVGEERTIGTVRVVGDR